LPSDFGHLAEFKERGKKIEIMITITLNLFEGELVGSNAMYVNFDVSMIPVFRFSLLL
jgi:hypothetical protein